MELIVNLIIVFVVIFSILKRIQEVGGKSEEIRAPRNTPREALSEQLKRVAKPEPPEPKTETAPGNEAVPPGPEKVTIEEIFKRFAEQQAPVRSEPVPEAKTAYEPAPKPEPAPEPVLFYEPEKPDAEIMRDVPVELPSVTPKPAPRKREKTPGVLPARTPLLNFEAPDVVRGIVMSEILGAPVSLREEPRW